MAARLGAYWIKPRGEACAILDRLGLFLLFCHVLLIFFQSTMIIFQLGLRPQQRDSLIDSQMFVLKVFYLSQMYVMDVRFLADVLFVVKFYEL